MINNSLDEELKFIKDKLRYASDFKAFVTEVIGLKCELFHSEWIDSFEKNRFNLLLAPRGHGKSLLVGSYILWNIVKDSNIRILIVTINQHRASDMMRFIQSNLETNTKLIDIFGSQKSNILWKNEALIVKDAKTKNNPTLKVAGVTGGLVGGHYDIIVLDDITDKENSRTETRRRTLEKQLDSEIMPMLENEPYGKIIVIGCLPSSEKVLTKNDGYKNINDIVIGDKVASYSDNGVEFKSVTAVIPQGESDVYELVTSYNKVRATDTHPFLRYNIDGTKEFVKMKNLGIGDYVVTITNYNNYKPKKIPEFGIVDEEFMWLFGFMIGDGWITKSYGKYNTTKWHVLFSLGIDEELNNKVINTIEKVFGYSPSKIRDDKRQVIYYRARLGRILENAGLAKGAKNKVIPDWVFNTSKSMRESLLRGLMDADGTPVGKFDRWTIECSSEKLIESIRRLCSITGFKSTKTYHRCRIQQPPNSKEPIEANSYHTAVTFNGNNIDKRYKSIFKDKLVLPNGFGLERVESINYIGKEEVYDLSIEDNHNFIAEGLVVHNTKWNQADLYAYINKKPGYAVNVYKALIHEPEELYTFVTELDWYSLKVEEAKQIIKDYVKTLINDNKPDVLWKWKVPYEELARKRRADGNVAFMMQYQNEFISDMDAPIKYDWVIAAQSNFKTPEYPYQTFLGVDLASKGVDSDYFTIIVIAVKDGLVYVLDGIRTKQASMFEQFELIRDMDKKWNPSKIGVEQAGQGKIIVDQYMDMSTLPIIPIKSSIVNDKMSRIQRLSVLFETGRIFISPDEKFAPLIDELLSYPRGAHNDYWDALSFSVIASQEFEDEGPKLNWEEISQMCSSRKSKSKRNDVGDVMSRYHYIKI